VPYDLEALRPDHVVFDHHLYDDRERLGPNFPCSCSPVTPLFQTEVRFPLPDGSDRSPFCSSQMEPPQHLLLTSLFPSRTLSMNPGLVKNELMFGDILPVTCGIPSWLPPALEDFFIVRFLHSTLKG